MWSRRQVLWALVLAGAAAPLAGCGFRPLHGSANTNAVGLSVDHQMAGIAVSPIANRDGQQLHNALRDRFNPLGQPAYASYWLDVSLTTRTYGALARRGLSATRRNVEMNAFYALRDTAGRIVLQERAEIVTGFDEFDDPLNDLSSLNDAVRRTTLQVADQIHTRVAVFLTEGTAPDMPAAKPAEKEPPTAVTPTGEPIGAWARKR